MPRLRSFRRRPLLLICADTLSYVLAVVIVTTVVAVPVSLAVGGGFTGAKAVLFLLGFLLLGYATIRLWPSSPEEVSGGGSGGDANGLGGVVPEETRFQAFARGLPPSRWVESPPPNQRLSPAGKLFWSSLAVLLVSYLMETVFGVV